MTNDSANPDIKLQSASANAEKTEVEKKTALEKKEPDAVDNVDNKNRKSKQTSNDDKLEEIDIVGDRPQKKIQKNIQVQFKSENGRLLLILPTEAQLNPQEAGWSDIWQQIKIRLNASDRLLDGRADLHLVASDRLLDGRQLQQLASVLRESNIHLVSVSTSRRQTAIAAVSAGYSVEQIKAKSLFNSQQETATTTVDALYLETTVRSGVDIRHSGSVTILGDVNPGGSVIADGDILVWGRLRGVAHAGANGNRQCLIMALQMEPTQLRIADAVARAPEKSLTEFYPEVAYVTPEGIRISKAKDFSRTPVQQPERDVSPELNFPEAQLLSQHMKEEKEID
ncbi:MAG: septum site-determining protein MinC [Cyanobacteria bacterium P01_A01_bin.84]